LLLFGLLASIGCSPDMRQQPRDNPLAQSEFFDDGRAARPPVSGTIARGQLRRQVSFFTGRANGELVAEIPVQVTRELLERGRERFNIFCSPCHGMVGDGEGMVVQRGFQHPPSLHIDRLRQAPEGHFYVVMTHGFGAMASYASRVTPADRWAITAYIRALQLSQAAALEDVPEAERQKLLESEK
jgi:hypothetical protein